MKVTLQSYTPEARELLLFSKATRLSMSAGAMDEIRAWPEEKKEKELAYILGTIQSSWEFVDYVFLIEDVSRAFTHQFVRTRDGDIGQDEVYTGPRHKTIASFAQQSQRTVDMSDFEFVRPDFAFDGVDPKSEEVFQHAMGFAQGSYTALIDFGVPPQDARAVLPTAVSTNMMAKFNLRTLSEMAKLRLCTRTQGEYQDVFKQMRLAILDVHPWAEPFLRVYCAATGVCCFPNYKECPIKPGIFNPDTGGIWPGGADGHIYGEGTESHWPHNRPLTKAEIQLRWMGTSFQAIPKSEMK